MNDVTTRSFAGLGVRMHPIMKIIAWLDFIRAAFIASVDVLTPSTAPVPSTAPAL
jgi:hypothetical protein